MTQDGYAIPSLFEPAPAGESVILNMSRRLICQTLLPLCPAKTYESTLNTSSEYSEPQEDTSPTEPKTEAEEYPEWGWPTPKPQDPCQRYYWFEVCNCKKTMKTRGCNKLSCTGCADTLRTRRKLSIRNRFEAARGFRPVLYTIFTVPKHLREKASDPKTWRKWRLAIAGVLKRRFGMDWGVERTDPAGKCKQSEKSGESCVCPKCSRWHPHMNFLWVQKGTGRNRPFITPAQMKYLKRRWAHIIGQTPGKPINIRHAYCKGDRDNEADVRRLNHWYSYMARTWADWQKSVRKHLRLNWYGAPQPEKKPKRECFCGDCGGDYVRWSTNNVEEAKFLATLDVRELWVALSNKNISEGTNGKRSWGGNRSRKRHHGEDLQE